ncbi:MAG TPA: hypothetical protein PKD09_09485 [Aggregatilinea sp.]|uniref:hypothetical protein n=1 Tax=Aggregatilinea sp. TaxID=2806333 RepID=UPI002BD19FF4|nr:hypothetical protein [Aggregatilinea sp.]HML21869.1 hypothetical protein [Aggregatilinea sp.]
MVSQLPASGNPLHMVGIVIPYRGPDDDYVVHLAGRKLAERFGSAAPIYDDASETVLVYSVAFGLSELDMTILVGIGMQCAARIEGVAVVIDGDAIIM